MHTNFPLLHKIGQLVALFFSFTPQVTWAFRIVVNMSFMEVIVGAHKCGGSQPFTIKLVALTNWNSSQTTEISLSQGICKSIIMAYKSTVKNALWTKVTGKPHHSCTTEVITTYRPPYLQDLSILHFILPLLGNTYSIGVNNLILLPKTKNFTYLDSVSQHWPFSCENRSSDHILVI